MSDPDQKPTASQSIAQICESLMEKVNEEACLPNDEMSNAALQNSKIRKDENNKIRKALENLKKATDYDTVEDDIKTEIEELSEIFPPLWKFYKGIKDTEGSVRKALNKFRKSQLVNGRLKMAIDQSLSKPETSKEMRRERR